MQCPVQHETKGPDLGRPLTPSTCVTKDAYNVLGYTLVLHHMKRDACGYLISLLHAYVSNRRGCIKERRKCIEERRKCIEERKRLRTAAYHDGLDHSNPAMEATPSREALDTPIEIEGKEEDHEG